MQVVITEYYKYKDTIWILKFKLRYLLFCWHPNLLVTESFGKWSWESFGDKFQPSLTVPLKQSRLGRTLRLFLRIKNRVCEWFSQCIRDLIQLKDMSNNKLLVTNIFLNKVKISSHVFSSGMEDSIVVENITPKLSHHREGDECKWICKSPKNYCIHNRVVVLHAGLRYLD